MISTNDLAEFLNRKFPPSSIEAWDNVGFSYFVDKKIKNVLIAIDLTNEIVDYAIKNSFDFILTYHTFFFEKISLKDTFKKYSYKQKIYKKLKKHQISAFSVHTNFDHLINTSVKQMIEKLGYEGNLIAIDNFNAILELKKPIKFNNIVNDYKNIFFLNSLQTNLYDNKTIKNITFLPGSAGIDNILKSIRTKKTDLYITSDLKWSEQITLNERKVNFLLVSHLVEQHILDYFQKIIYKKFNNQLKIEIKFLQEILINL
ncbi:Uncharacterized protein conserved in bacteria [Mesomycoplasma neurolyticum]|uniref:GTP cyclohydrolase 1 type 2 homolog n=2 Tax=Mesomycoplasma neurolyticum TaxID=2120 RepID=A0A449A4Q0_9BACT|nr:Uncharacterized protein conserved in bacteria [Mesomycoplasma neurolyticum]